MAGRPASLTPLQRFGDRVAAERARRGWSLRELCVRAALPPAPSRVLSAERGEGIRLDIAARIARTLGLSLDGLIDPCAQCGDKPPAGFTFQACGADGPVS
jgi:transcriptional regulator with XRE-family HTH domain